ncbi:MAG: molybdopterin-dependent oxidoreductase [Methylobacter sp.]|nr:molybdopterin-dependent oxidoreductase [Methylobacter sp.]
MTTRIFRQLTFILIFMAGYASLTQAAPSCLGGASTGFKLNGAVTHPKSFTPTTLSQYKTSKMTVSYFSGSSGLVTKTFIGVPLYDLITEAGVITDSTRKNDMLRKYLVVNATDCYQAIVAAAEILPAGGGQQAMVAFETVDETGAIVPLDDSEGAVRLVMPGDKTGGRYVSNVNTITVRSAP